jgi:Flp pilus assembly protein TadD
VLLAAGTAYAAGGGTAAAQNRAPGAAVQPLPAGDEGAELRRHLADLAANPRSLASLIGAGRAAVRVGDGEAALGFFGRAEEVAPNDARVKAGMGSSYVLLGQPQAALRLFAEASQFGAPEAEIARDRGLAYDLSGNPRRAQQDYLLVLQRGEDAETRRRLALSLAVSGHRDAALRALDPLLRRHDRAAYRTRAFVLALTGDANGAIQAVDGAMPGQGAAMAPFLTRLAGLAPAQKALAVHFGHFPADGRPVQTAAVDTSPLPAAVAFTGAAPAAPTRFAAAAQPAPRGANPRRRTALADPVSRRDEARGRSEERRQPVRTASSTSRPSARPPAVTSVADIPGAGPIKPDEPAAQVEPGFGAVPAPAQQQPVQIAAGPPLEIPPAMRQDSPPPVRQEPVVRREPATPVRQEPAPTPVRQEPPVAARREPAAAAAAEAPAAPAFSDVAALVQSLPAEEEPRPAAPAPTRGPTSRPAAAPARTAATPTRATRTAARTPARPAPPPHPSRHWVQVANGDRSAFAFQLGRLRQTAPDLLRTRTAYWARNGGSARLLVGPFATAAEARAFVNQLSRQHISAFPWTSEAGEEVARLPAR